MIDLPLPLPDWRTTNAKNKNAANNNQKQNQKPNFINNVSSYNSLKYNSINSDVNSSKNEDLRESSMSSLKATSLIKLKQVEDMRQKILSYKLLTEKAIFLNNNTITNTNPENYVEKCNIILFGPSGSGKSSFIKSL